MALLTLKDIGKIYVSDSNVSVGIRGVNLSFERGEFVAVTGKSGSGKSTLLNIISGMDTYEEGELFIHGQPTSHYLQPEWEEYREKYISFIFQDYNIIDSLTVLQNVELALMHIEDTALRRQRALDLLARVGMTSHIRQKGSKLSGGQKQRTVIARALAKDSPIILADEPTGNLDSKTSEEIISLLREVSHDKLLIVVTHNFEQVEQYATRHIRIFDGAVESDTGISHAPAREEDAAESAHVKEKRNRKKELKNGWILGKTIFAAKPRLSFFLCLLMILGTLGIFAVTTMCGAAGNLFKPQYMFTHMDGRVILTTQNGEVIPEEKLKELAERYGAKSHLRIDFLLDRGPSYSFSYLDEEGYNRYFNVNAIYNKTYGEPSVGTYPKENNEVLLYLPISYQTAFGKDSLLIDEIRLNDLSLKVTGIRYYYDNNILPECLFTEDGFRTVTAIDFILNRSDITTMLTVKPENAAKEEIYLSAVRPCFDMPADRIYVSEALCKEWTNAGVPFTCEIAFTAHYRQYDYNYYDKPTHLVFSRVFSDDSFTSDPTWAVGDDRTVVISDEFLREIAEEVLDRSYTQASLFFESDKRAHEAAEQLQNEGYVAVPSDTEYTPGADAAIGDMLGAVVMAGVWIVSIVFLAFFIHLCSARALDAFKGDMAIMRSMGIPVQVIRIGMYTRMLLSLIPAFLCMMLTAVLIFTSPQWNEFFVYLYAWQYAAIVLGMILLTVRITRLQVRRLFGESVKKSLKGDPAQ